jgi:hypothetical protein
MFDAAMMYICDKFDMLNAAMAVRSIVPINALPATTEAAGGSPEGRVKSIYTLVPFLYTLLLASLVEK